MLITVINEYSVESLFTLYMWLWAINLQSTEISVFLEQEYSSLNILRRNILRVYFFTWKFLRVQDSFFKLIYASFEGVSNCIYLYLIVYTFIYFWVFIYCIY